MRRAKPTSYGAWLETVSAEITGDSLWRMEAYRLALFAAELGWHYVTRLMRDRRTVKLAGQLYDALGSVGANLAEEYSRGTGRDRARFYEYALGSARESRTWYVNGHHVLGDAVTTHRLRLLTKIIRLTLTMILQQRAGTIREAPARYAVETREKPDEMVSSKEAPTLMEELSFSI